MTIAELIREYFPWILGTFVGALLLIANCVVIMLRHRWREQSVRELFAYVAEGSINSADTLRLLDGAYGERGEFRRGQGSATGRPQEHLGVKAEHWSDSGSKPTVAAAVSTGEGTRNASPDGYAPPATASVAAGPFTEREGSSPRWPPGLTPSLDRLGGVPMTELAFQNELSMEIGDAEREGREFIDITSRDIHRKVGGYPGHNHRMPVCCEVMYANMGPGDEVVAAPPKGLGARLTIRYKLPRYLRSASAIGGRRNSHPG